jgi:hypothetical protein
METFRTMVDLNELTNKEELERAVLHILLNPVFQKDIEIATCILSIDPWQLFAFDESIKSNMSIAKLLIQRPTFNVTFDRSLTTQREFIDYVFRERPHYARKLPRGTHMIQAFSPELTEYVMHKICTRVYSHKILKFVPVWVKRIYAHDKLREKDSFQRLLFEDKTNIVTRLPSELKRQVADFLGLVVSNRWACILTCIQRQIY